MALRLFEKKGVRVQRIQVDENPGERARMRELTGRRTVPQIFVGNRHIGGYSDVAELDMQGELDDILVA